MGSLGDGGKPRERPTAMRQGFGGSRTEFGRG
jgi:hypothetical protein